MSCLESRCKEEKSGFLSVQNVFLNAKREVFIDMEALGKDIVIEDLNPLRDVSSAFWYNGDFFAWPFP